MIETRPTPEEYVARIAAEAAAPDTRTVREHDMFRTCQLFYGNLTITVDQRVFSAEYGFDDLSEDELRAVIHRDAAETVAEAFANGKWASLATVKSMPNTLPVVGGAR
jgi:hypothetical protein